MTPHLKWETRNIQYTVSVWMKYHKLQRSWYGYGYEGVWPKMKIKSISISQITCIVYTNWLLTIQTSKLVLWNTSFIIHLRSCSLLDKGEKTLYSIYITSVSFLYCVSMSSWFLSWSVCLTAIVIWCSCWSNCNHSNPNCCCCVSGESICQHKWKRLA